MVPSRSRALRCAATALLAMVALIVLVSPAAWARGGRTKGGISAEAAGCPIGVCVTSLRDLDPVGDSFGIDFWVWSVHPPGDDPLDSLEFVNAKQIETRLERTTKRGDREWSRLKARPTVLHDWDLTNFPFDRLLSSRLRPRPRLLDCKPSVGTETRRKQCAPRTSKV